MVRALEGPNTPGSWTRCDVAANEGKRNGEMDIHREST